MQIVDLPEHLYADAVGLWHEVGLTRPWNDPDADLKRAMVGPTSTVLAALDDDGRCQARRWSAGVRRARWVPPELVGQRPRRDR